MKKKIIIAIVAILLVVGGVVAFNNYKQKSANSNLPFIAANPAIPGEEFKFTDEETKQYNETLNEALKYKSEGDQGKTESYQKAIDLYAKAASIGQGKVWVPYLDLGNVYRLMKNFPLAEAAYNEGLKISAEPLIYQSKIELYRYDLKKPPQEVIDIYQDALSKVVENTNLFIDYGYYLGENGHYQEALDVFKELVAKFPDNKDFQAEVETLKKKV